MKKLLVFVGVLMIVPLSAFAMEELADDVMGDITGQAGVTITFGGTDTTVVATSTGVAWGDPDGNGDPVTGAAAHLRIDGDMVTTTTVAGGSSLTIDLQDGVGVIIGLAGMDVGVTMEAAQLTIGAGSGATPIWAADPAAVLGVLSLNQTTVDLALPSALIISPH